MGIRVRPIGEMKSQPDPTERVKCWKCATWFMMSRTATRGSCPSCGSQVALHRLKMPTMPSGKRKQEVIRLPATGEEGVSRKLKKETALEDGGETRPGSPTESDPVSGVYQKRSGSELGEGEIRRMFVEADPRREGGASGREILKGVTIKALIASVGVATLALLILIFLIES